MKWIANLRERSVEERRRRALIISAVATIVITLAWLAGESAMSREKVEVVKDSEPIHDVASLIAPLEGAIGEGVYKIRELVKNLRN